jgi:hypothetical protein
MRRRRRRTKKMSKHIPREQLEHLIWKPGDDTQPSPETVQPVPQPRAHSPIEGPFEFMERTGTYALGVQALRDSYSRGECSAQPLFTKDDGSTIVRPLTFQETLKARVEDYENTHSSDGTERSKDDRLRLFQYWIDSATGVAYKARTTQFKVIPLCRPLVEIDAGVNDNFMNVEYGALAGTELDSGAGKYGAWLTKDEVVDHPAWRAAVEDDVDLLRTYRDIVFSERSSDIAMAFFVGQNTDSDELRALCVNSLYSDSYAIGNDSLSYYGSFLRVAHADAPEGRRTKK